MQDMVLWLVAAFTFTTFELIFFFGPSIWQMFYCCFVPHVLHALSFHLFAALLLVLT